jgi:hypothetical protein
MRVAVFGAVAEFLHEFRRRIAKVYGHAEGALFGVYLRRLESGVDGVGFRCDSQKDQRLRDGQLAGIISLIAPVIFSMAITAWSQAMAHMRQCSLISACIMHSAEHARHIIMQVCIIDIITCMSYPVVRSIMRMVVSHTSAQFAHIAAHRPKPSPASASAHMMHACMHAERASIHSCIMSMSMSFMGMSDADMAPFIMSIVMFIRTPRRLRVPGVDVAGHGPGDPVERHATPRAVRAEGAG